MKDVLSDNDKEAIRKEIETLKEGLDHFDSVVSFLTVLDFCTQQIERTCGLPSNITEKDLAWAREAIKELGTTQDKAFEKPRTMP